MASRLLPLIISIGVGFGIANYTFKPMIQEFWESEEGQRKLAEYNRMKAEREAEKRGGAKETKASQSKRES
eukprot:CAMPEP_0114506164 /NCGR_PEP_ID=MMETSP0109-20121206/11270_1 /TAXON_ID=29199 /ORGANISM="Chlorarachnion reptans, Strain CCCM449" /LENGTH=70 /DNA_ID=CAMNT_0001684711 /DNA_START=281 /DNA_END=493 /DNA_ORIENTATION=+